MVELFDKIHMFRNSVKGFTVGYSVTNNKMLFDFAGRRWVAEFREVVNPAEHMVDDMRRIQYL